MRLMRRGDTVVEVIFAITIFCLVAIISITLMNSGISNAQGSLELTMARNEIDAQAEAIRFIQNSFLAEREVDPTRQQFTQLWRRMTRSSDDCSFTAECGLAIEPEDLAPFDLATCGDVYNQDAPRDLFENRAFVVNTRLLQPSNSDFAFDDFFDSREPDNNYDKLTRDIIVSATTAPDAFIPAPIYPRLVFSHHGYNSDESSDQLVEEEEGVGKDSPLYRVVARAEGIWIIAVRSEAKHESTNEPEFFDFYIRTCWYEPGSDAPTAIGTIVRLYNPEVVE